MVVLDSKDVEEQYAIEFQFSAVLEEVTSAVVTVELLTGSDLSPDSLLNGPLQINGTSVYQRIKAGVNDCTYKLRCVAKDANNADETYALAAVIGVVAV